MRADAGRVHDALRGYGDVIDSFARTGLDHQRVTLRNLARLLRQLDDHEAAELLDTAADHALDAPAASAVPKSRPQQRRAVSRAQALEVARQAIEQNLSLRQVSTQ